MFFVYLIIALVAGVALATQSAINTQLAKAMSGEAVIATFYFFCRGNDSSLFYCLGENRFMGKFVCYPFTTLVEINRWGTWCNRRLHNGFACA